MNAVIESVDSGEDLSATTNSGGGDTAGATSPNDQGSNTPTGGGGSTTAGEGDAGSTAVGAVADAQPASGSGADGKDKLVPLAALHEQRELVKSLKSQISALEAQPKLSAEDADVLKELRAQKKSAQEPKAPDFLEDPKGYVDATVNKTAAELKALREANQRFSQQQEHQQQLTQILTGVQHHEQAFVKATPDYHQAVDHIRSVRSAQLQMLYPQATAQQIQHQIATEEIGAAAQILQGGGNPADFVYRYAKTLGYAPKGATPPANSASAADKDAVRTLGNGGGGADKAEETPDDELGSAMKAALAERFGVRKKR